MSLYVFPSKNNVGSGKLITEGALRKTINLGKSGFVLDGFKPVVDNNNIIISPGVVSTNGFIVINNSNISVSPIFSENVIALNMQFDTSGYLSNISIANLNKNLGPFGANYIPICYVKTQGGSIEEILDLRKVIGIDDILQSELSDTFAISGVNSNKYITFADKKAIFASVVDGYKIQFSRAGYISLNVNIQIPSGFYPVSFRRNNIDVGFSFVSNRLATKIFDTSGLFVATGSYINVYIQTIPTSISGHITIYFKDLGGGLL